MWRARKNRPLLRSKLIQPFRGIDQGASRMIRSLPWAAALAVVGGGTIRGASGPPSAFFGDLELFAEVESLREGTIILFIAGQPIHFEHAEQRFILHPPGLLCVIGWLVERT